VRARAARAGGAGISAPREVIEILSTSAPTKPAGRARRGPALAAEKTGQFLRGAGRACADLDEQRNRRKKPPTRQGNFRLLRPSSQSSGTNFHSFAGGYATRPGPPTNKRLYQMLKEPGGPFSAASRRTRTLDWRGQGGGGKAAGQSLRAVLQTYCDRPARIRAAAEEIGGRPKNTTAARLELASCRPAATQNAARPEPEFALCFRWPLPCVNPHPPKKGPGGCGWSARSSSEN